MRLFGDVSNDTIDSDDRPTFFATIFTLAFAASITVDPDAVAGAPLPPIHSYPPRLGLLVRDSITGPLLGDWTEAQGVSFSTNEHGFAELTGFKPAGLAESFSFYRREDPFHIELTDGRSPVYQGRVEDIRIVPGGFGFTAFGYWRAFDDLLINADYSNTDLSDWGVLQDDEVAEVDTPVRYENDKYSRLYMAPKTDATFADNEGHGSFGYAVPDLSSTQLTRITFNWYFKAPSPWTVELTRCDKDWSVNSVVWSEVGDGTLQTGSSELVTFAATDALRFTMYYDNATPTTFTGETGDVYFKATEVRVDNYTAGEDQARRIVTDLVEYISSVNPTQLSDDVSLIGEQGLTVWEARYEDVRASDILNDLGARGDNQTPPKPWVGAVWEDQRLIYNERGARGRHWYVDVADMTVERSWDTKANRVYGKFRNEQRGDKRTAKAALNSAGVIREDYVDIDTLSQTTAENFRDTLLNENSVSRPRATIRTYGLYDSAGVEFPLFSARAGDTMTLRNLPPELGEELEGIQTFRLGGTRYNVEDNILEPQPEQPIPTLAIMVARRRQN